MCGTPAKPDADFCAECDSLVARAASPRPTLAVASVAGTFATPPLAMLTAPTPRSSSSGGRPSRGASGATGRSGSPGGSSQRPDPAPPSIECWDCGIPNPPSRAFCKSCGVWIAIGGGSVTAASGDTASGSAVGPRAASGRRSAVAASALASPGSSDTGATGSQPSSSATNRVDTLQARANDPRGPRPISLGHQSIVRKRRLAVAVSALVVAGIVGVAALQLASVSDDRSDDAMLAGAAVTTTTSSISGPVEPGVAPAGVLDPGDAAADPARPAREDRSAEATAVPARTTKPTAAGKPSSADRSTTAALPAVTSPTDAPAPPAPSAPKPGDEAVPVTAQAAASARQPRGGAQGAPPARLPSAAASDSPEPAWRTGWVCDGSVRIGDLTRSGWSIGKVTFRNGTAFDRVTLRLQRLGPDGGAPVSLRAEAFPTGTTRQHFPRLPQPAAGGTTVGLRFEDGVQGVLGLRGYRPQGVDLIKQFSAFPGAGGSASMLVTVASEGCFRLRAPDWAAGSSARQAEVHLDIRR